MSAPTTGPRMDYPPQPHGGWYGRPDVARRTPAAGPDTGLLLAGLAVIRLGALAWYYFGPDFRRYMKIRSM